MGIQKRKSVEEPKRAKKSKAQKVESEDEEMDIDHNELEDKLDEDEEEDELDNEEASEEDDEEESGDKESGEGDKNNRAEQRKLKKERKLSRANGTTIQHIKQLWERVRVKTGLPSEQRKKLIDEIWKLSHDSIKDIVFKHDSSRVIQTLFKYADKERRRAITDALKGSYVELSKSSYGKYLLIKILHYGDKSVREQVINELHGHYRKLMRHKEGAYVIEDIYREYSTAAQKAQIVREFYGSEFAVFREEGHGKTLASIVEENPTKRQFVMRNLKEVITSAVNKGSIGFNIIHAAMLEYVKNIDPQTSEREEFIDLISEQIAEIVHTTEGSQVACLVFSMATAKEKKGLVKALKPFVSKMAEDDQGHIALITLLDTVDDTVLVSKSFSPELKEHLPELIVSKCGRRPLLYILLGRNTRYFTPATIKRLEQYDELKKNTAKKDDAARLAELNKAFSPLILECISTNAATLVAESLGSQFIAEALLYCNSTSKGPVAQTVVECFGGNPADAEHLIHQPFSGRMLKSLIQGGSWNAKEKRVEKVEGAETVSEAVLSALFESISEYPKEWACGEGAFTVVSVLENCDSKQKATLVKKLKSYAKDIASSESKGSKVIMEQLSN